MFTSGQNCLVIGISGATCSGKTTFANGLHQGILNSVPLNQDQFYWEEDSANHTFADGIKHINWELVTAFDNDKFLTKIKYNFFCFLIRKSNIL